MNSNPVLGGQSAIITGASQGLGYEVARAFLAAGASVSMCARDVKANNAGTLGPMGRTEDLNLDQFRETIEVNLYGVFYACRAVAPDMRARAHGKILTLSGGGAATPRAFSSPYAISKAIVIGLSERICQRLGLNSRIEHAGAVRGWVGDNPFIFLDCARIRALGWKPRLTIQEGVVDTVSYLEAKRHLLEAEA